MTQYHQGLKVGKVCNTMCVQCYVTVWSVKWLGYKPRKNVGHYRDGEGQVGQLILGQSTLRSAAEAFKENSQDYNGSWRNQSSFQIYVGVIPKEGLAGLCQPISLLEWQRKRRVFCSTGLTYISADIVEWVILLNT